MNQFPMLCTERLDLIEIKQSHLDDLLHLFGDTEVVKFYNLLPFKQETDGRKFVDWYDSRFKEGLAIRWGIAEKGQPGIIGTIGFNNYIKHHRAGIGYDLQTRFWNKGYITEALKAVITYGFDMLGINRIEAEVMQGNIASEKVLEKLNFTKEGVLRQWMLWNENYYDMTMFSLLKTDCPNGYKA